jgi:hypothetical protein
LAGPPPEKSKQRIPSCGRNHENGNNQTKNGCTPLFEYGSFMGIIETFLKKIFFLKTLKRFAIPPYKTWQGLSQDPLNQMWFPITAFYPSRKNANGSRLFQTFVSRFRQNHKGGGLFKDPILKPKPAPVRAFRTRKAFEGMGLYKIFLSVPKNLELPILKTRLEWPSVPSKKISKPRKDHHGKYLLIPFEKIRLQGRGLTPFQSF